MDGDGATVAGVQNGKRNYEQIDNDNAPFWTGWLVYGCLFISMWGS